MVNKLYFFLLSKRFDLLLILALFVFSSVLYWKTFYVKENQIFISTKVWSDFGATLPIIRSFSFGENIPPQYPHFAGEPIRYHFLFYLIVGILERTGVRIDFALNILSSIGMTCLMYLIYKGGEIIFKNKKVGLLSLIFFVFNGSFGFLEYFKLNKITSSIFYDIFSNNTFTSFGPYDGKIVSAFWSLNIYTNQRHLAFGYAIFLAIFLYLYHRVIKHKSLTYNASLILGIIVGLMPFFHMVVYAMLGIVILFYFLFYTETRKHLFITGFIAILIALPQFIYMGQSSVDTEYLKIGYLADTITQIPYYWLMNLGILIFLFPVGLYIANKNQRKLFVVFLLFFVIANTIRLSPEIAANHKLVNMFVIGINWFVALSIITIWNKTKILKFFVPLVVIFITLTGIIDFFPIINDKYIVIDDIPKNKIANFIEKNTSKDSVFLNSSFIFHPASIAGRNVYLGWPYYSWSAGYDTNSRNEYFTKMYTSTNRSDFCKLAVENGIDYVTVEDTKGDKNLPNINVNFFKENFMSIYKDADQDYYIFPISGNCTKI